jgi:hypothetical protein
MSVSTCLQFSSPNRELTITPCENSLFRPEVGNWYLVYQGRPSYNHVWHSLVMVDNMRLSKSCDRKVQNFSTAGVDLKPLGGSCSLLLWSIKKTIIYSHPAQSGDGQLHETVYILYRVNTGCLILILITIFHAEKYCSTESHWYTSIFSPEVAALQASSLMMRVLYPEVRLWIYVTPFHVLRSNSGSGQLLPFGTWHWEILYWGMLRLEVAIYKSLRKSVLEVPFVSCSGPGRVLFGFSLDSV